MLKSIRSAGDPPTPRGGSVRDRDPGHPKMAKFSGRLRRPGKSGIAWSQIAILQGKSVLRRSRKHQISLPPMAAEIWYFGASKSSFSGRKRSDSCPKLRKFDQSQPIHEPLQVSPDFSPRARLMDFVLFPTLLRITVESLADP